MKEQECIPVGCVLSAAVPIMGWVSTPPWEQIPPGQTPQLPPWVWAWKPARHAGIPPPADLLQGMLGYHLQCMLGYHPPVDRHTRVKS